ncbi:hypothetical protein [Microbacterium murale]|uniref:Uncharacterized protein n=1 Tax=Microbacterium murale TaxID=1081040 RepID=A0ABU0PAB2_9MICO|nr:hypothetical protein [Microbacterium murale]MDQ0644268.1 hypothetical protein [Microbacterium murale]
MSESERGNTKHGPHLDDQMEQETRGMVQGHGSPHAEPFRESEPLPDDTDDQSTERAFRNAETGEHATEADENAADARAADRQGSGHE